MIRSRQTEKDPNESRSTRWSRIFNRFIPIESIGTDADELSRARMLIGAIATVCFFSTSGVFWTAINGPYANAPVCVAMALLSAATAWAYKWSRSLDVGVHLLNAVILVGLTGLIVNTGGQTIPPFMALPVLPLLGALVASARTGLIWGAVGCLALAVGISVWSGLGPFGSANHQLDHTTIQYGKFYGSALMLGVVTAVCMFEDRLRRASLGALAEAKRLSEERYRQVVAQQRLLEAAQFKEAETRDRFFSHVSHELRTPLTPLHQFLTLVLDEVAGPIENEQREFLEVALRNANQLKKLIGDLTDAARVQSTRPHLDREVADLSEVASRACEEMASRAEAKGVTLELIADPSLNARCDSAWILRALESILENAIRFSPEANRVEVRVVRDPETRGVLRLSVRDYGPGIETEARKRIFYGLAQEKVDEWETRRGLGLGLFIAGAIVKHHGGRIWVESEKGKGATFSFTIDEFDRRKLFRRVIFESEKLQRELGIVVVALKSLEGDAVPAAHLQRRLHAELELLVYPHVDVVLPIGTPDVPNDRHVVLVRVDQAGLTALLERLQSHFASFEPFVEAGVEVAILARRAQIAADDARDPEAAFESACARIDAVLAEVLESDAFASSVGDERLA